MATVYENASFFERHLTLLSALIIGIGGLVYGIDSGLFATVIAHGTFKTYMFGPSGTNTVLLGAMSSTYAAGQCVGSFSAGWINDKWGRKLSISLAAGLTLIGCAIQTASNGVGMMIGGRVVAGIATGWLNATMPTYLSEISVPEKRAFVLGMQGIGDACGFMLANWIGYFGIFAKGNAQWRIPLGVQLISATLLIALMYFVPESPRWLFQQDRADEAQKILARLHANRGEVFVLAEATQIHDQIQKDKREITIAPFLALFSRRYIRRTVTAIGLVSLLQLNGGGVVQQYQSIIYGNLGFKGNTVLFISGCYGFMGVIGQLLNIFFVADKWPRVMTVCAGCIVEAGILSILMALSKFYGSGTNTAGAGAGVAFIFLFSGLYALFFNSTLYTIASEILPTHLRAQGMAVTLFCLNATGIWLGQVSPIAFSAITWKFYTVFIVVLVLFAIVTFFFVPETNQLSLEDVEGAFGEDIAGGKFEARKASLEQKATAMAHVEEV